MEDLNALNVKVAEIDSRSKSNTHRLDKVEERLDKQDEIIQGMGILSVKVSTVEQDVTEIKGDVKELTSKPAKRWDALVGTVIGVIVGALLALAFKSMGIA